MFELGTPWWAILIRTSGVYLAVLVGLRLTGKRQIGQMAPFDLVLILLLANAVQNAMVGPDNSLLGGLIAGAVLLTVNFAVSRLNRAIPRFQRFAEGHPVVLVSHGQVVAAALRAEGIGELELEQAVREHGIETLGQVELAVLEVDGSISIVSEDQNVLRTRRRFRQVQHRG